jgi:CPA1 family monovalent cation:H+ antiporter
VHIPALLLVVLAAGLLYVLNRRLGGLPPTIGVTLWALAASLLLLTVGALWSPLHEFARELVARVDFRATLLDGMLSLLLFAGALQVDLDTLLGEKALVGVLATVGVVVTTALVGGAMFAAARACRLPLDLGDALLFGAIVSPTDPIAVIGMLRTSRAPKRLEVQMAGESLFNDAVGVVIFFAVAKVAAGRAVHAPEVALMLVEEVVGGLAIGLAAGWGARKLLRKIDDGPFAILTTLVLALGITPLAGLIDASGYLAIIVVGLLLGESGRGHSLPTGTAGGLHKFWGIVDEILNVILFAMVGFEVLIVPFTARVLVAGLLAIPITLLARLLVVAGTLAPFAGRLSLPPRSVAILTWGGLRGGLAIALALSVGPEIASGPALLAMTYVVVVFSIVVQGLSFRRLLPRP